MRPWGRYTFAIHHRIEYEETAQMRYRSMKKRVNVVSLGMEERWEMCLCGALAPP